VLPSDGTELYRMIRAATYDPGVHHN